MEQKQYFNRSAQELFEEFHVTEQGLGEAQVEQIRAEREKISWKKRKRKVFWQFFWISSRICWC